MNYNFELVHISGKKNGWADALSRRPDYKMGEEDNKQLVVLPPKFFERTLARVAGSEEVDPNNPKFLESMGITRGIPGFQTLQNLVEQDQQENPKSQETIRRWSNTHQLMKLVSIWWKDDRLVVASDNDLKRGVIHFFHDKPWVGHPGISNTYKLAKRDFWWPNMLRPPQTLPDLGDLGLCGILDAYEQLMYQRDR